MHNIEILQKNKSLSMFHINACSLNKNFHDLQHLLNCTKNLFDIIAISETRITKQVSLLNNLNLNNYSFKFTLTETFSGRTLLYITNHLSYKCSNEPILKEEFHNNYKKYRNLLLILVNKSRQTYDDKYFEGNWNNIKNSWKGIKSLISLKTIASSVPTIQFLDNSDTITNPFDIANTFKA